MNEQIKSNRKEIQAEESARRAQRYQLEISEFQRHLMMAPLRRLKGHERTKPERELLKYLKEMEPTKETKATKKKIKEHASTNGKVKPRKLPGARVSKARATPAAPKPGKLGKGRKYD